MLSNSQVKYGTYGFRFKGKHQQRVAGIYSVGWEQQTYNYAWNGLTRSEKNIIVFQYTLKGNGAIRVGEHTYHLEAGKGFFVKIPSDHQYYLPSDSKEWEFIHLTLFGDEAMKFYEKITNDFGHILELDLYSVPIIKIFTLLKKVSDNQLNDAYEASALAFSFLMELKRLVLNIKSKQDWPDSVAKAIVFIKNNYTSDITLDDIVNASGISKYHFTRVFHENTHLTPIQYLTQTRINKAIKLLKNKALTIDDIAKKIGFSNGNYFSKVFRASLGVPPGEYRNSESFAPVDHLIRDY